MRLFMLGWEFPPFISGGLGTACYGLTKAMSSLGADIMFVLPRPVSAPVSTPVRLVWRRPGSPLAGPGAEFRPDEFEHVSFRAIDSRLVDPYASPERGTAADRTRTSKNSAVDDEIDVAQTADARFVHAPARGAGDPYAGDMFAE